MRRQHLTQLIGTFVVAAALVGLPTVAFAGIATTAHNLNGQYGLTEICLPCHTPHNATTETAAPLWNHDVPLGSTFTPYADLAGTLDATDVGEPSGVSLLCLSCHDGVTAIDSFGGASGTALMTGARNVGQDLSNDHPISFDYDAAQGDDSGLLVSSTTAAPLTGSIADEMLFGVGNTQVECASCHDVHDDSDGANASLLRITNVDSVLCLTCHDK
jgi:predicted CXXCH cytochrome family protein